MIAGKKRKAVMVVRLSFFCMLGSRQRIQIQRHQGTKEAVRDDILNNYGDEDSELYPEQEYSYDGFLDDVVRDAAWNQTEESYVSLSGTTGPSYESVPFTCSFSFENLVFCFDYTWDGVEETEFVQGTIGSDGSLDANLQFEDSETGEEDEFGLSAADADKAFDDYCFRADSCLSDLCLIVSFWNTGIGLHTFFVFKTEGRYFAYNRNEIGDVEDCGEKCINLNNNDFSGFIVGYLIYD